MRETVIKKTEGPVFKPNNFSLKVLQDMKPLIDNSHTPRGVKKLITLERNFDHYPWVYNKQHLELFSETTRDIKKGKTLRRKVIRM